MRQNGDRGKGSEGQQVGGLGSLSETHGTTSPAWEGVGSHRQRSRDHRPERPLAWLLPSGLGKGGGAQVRPILWVWGEERASGDPTRRALALEESP